MNHPPHVVIVGGGPAGLMAAVRLCNEHTRITLIDHKPAPGRKLLVAGDGGFNLTHSEDLPAFLEKYDCEWIRNCVRQFTPADFRVWLKSIGIETRVGSSGKVFPLEGIKPIQVLNSWLGALDEQKVEKRFRTKLIDFDAFSVLTENDGKRESLNYDYLVVALGGASWSKTGSDGHWIELFRDKGIPVVPFQSGNSGLELPYREWLLKYEGTILKNIRLKAGNVLVAGDCVVSSYGLEGKPAYAVNRPLRLQHFKGLTIDFKPQSDIVSLAEIIRHSKNVREAFRKMKIPDAIYDLFRENLSKDQFTDPDLLASCIRGFEIQVSGLRPLDEVISTVGGVAVETLDPSGKLHHWKNVYCCGEMIDWDAPTGGYLIQGCVSSGYVVGQTIAERLD